MATFLTPGAIWLAPLGGELALLFLPSGSRKAGNHCQRGLHRTLKLWGTLHTQLIQKLEIKVKCFGPDPAKRRGSGALPVPPSRGNHAEHRSFLRSVCHLRRICGTQLSFRAGSETTGQGQAQLSRCRFGASRPCLVALHSAHVCPRWGPDSARGAPGGTSMEPCCLDQGSTLMPLGMRV